jgi:hypothetical protein
VATGQGPASSWRAGLRTALLIAVAALLGAACTPAGEAVPTTIEPLPQTTSTSSLPALGASDVLAFIDDFSGWLADDDVSALVDSLHPFVIERGGVDACRAFVADQIVRFEDYTATGEPIGPTPLRFPEGDAEVWTVPVSFVYEGDRFDTEAVVSVESGAGEWFTECS